MRVLIAEDDVFVARRLSCVLTAAGFTVDHTDQGEEALEMILRFNYDAVMLDEALPILGGLAVLQSARNACQNTPAVILASKPSVKLKIAAFCAGADDVVAIPVDPGEFVARLRAITRRSRGHIDSSVRIGSLVVDLDRQQASCDGRILKLTSKEFRVLELLVLRKGSVLTRDAFMNRLYGGLNEPGMKIVDVFVCKLRKKLRSVGIKDLIINIRGYGYMLEIGQPVAPPALNQNTLPLAKLA